MQQLNKEQMGINYYFVIYCGEDGDVLVDRYEKDVLLDALKENYYGGIGFFDKMPDDNDPQCWPNNKALIIKGDIVTPKPVDVVREYEI